MNVLEHIKHDRQAPERLFEPLVPGRHLSLFVPADQALYGTMDRQVGRFHWDSRQTLANVIREASFDCDATHHNMYGHFGGWFSAHILKRKHIAAAQVRKGSKRATIVEAEVVHEDSDEVVALASGTYAPIG